MTPQSELLAEYDSFQKKSAYYFDRAAAAIQLSGKDRVSFLNNFCTADIKLLQTGDLAEAFVLNPKGKTLFFIQVLAFDDRLALLIPVEQVDELLSHLSRYLIVEVVTIERMENAQVVYASWPFEGSFACHVGSDICAGVLNSADAPDNWRKDGKVEISRETFDAIRVENRFPVSGIDVTEDCLAQEFERNETAISFTKGCYLGQETVARLDALGHTNRAFCVAKVDGNEPPILDSELSVDGKKAGKATSAAWSPHHQAHLILAMVKKPHHQTGQFLQLGDRQVTIVDAGY